MDRLKRFVTFIRIQHDVIFSPRTWRYLFFNFDKTHPRLQTGSLYPTQDANDKQESSSLSIPRRQIESKSRRNHKYLMQKQLSRIIRKCNWRHLRKRFQISFLTIILFLPLGLRILLREGNSLGLMGFHEIFVLPPFFRFLFLHKLISCAASLGETHYFYVTYKEFDPKTRAEFVFSQCTERVLWSVTKKKRHFGTLCME